METFNINLQQFKNANSMHLVSNKKENTLDNYNNFKINENAMYGNISCQSISKNISLFSMHLTAKGEHEIILSRGEVQPLSFIYCQSGDIEILFSSDKKRQYLSKFQTAIISGKKDDTVTLKIKTSEPCGLTIFMLDKKMSDDKETSDVIQSLLHLITNGEEDIRVNHICSRNLKISVALKELNDIEEEGIVKRLLVAGKLRTILAMEYKQLLDDMNETNYDGCSLSKTELQKVADATELIHSELDRDFTVTSLSREVLLSVNKLQEGFKAIHNRTVTDYIRNARLEEAERLLKTTDYNISEVVYMVGFLSRSYFSKIFKMKYDCNPSDYKTQVHSQVA